MSDLPDRGRSITATFKHNFVAVKAFIDEKPYATFDEIELETSFSRGTIFTIVHHHLDMRKKPQGGYPTNIKKRESSRLQRKFGHTRSR